MQELSSALGGDALRRECNKIIPHDLQMGLYIVYEVEPQFFLTAQKWRSPIISSNVLYKIKLV